MPAVPSEPNTDFRPYRRFLAWTVLVFVALGSSWVLVSVAFTIYQRGRVPDAGGVVSEEVTVREMKDCFDKLSEVTGNLGKHLENFHHLLGRYDQDEAQSWADEGTNWRRRWLNLGQQCRLSRPANSSAKKVRKEMEQMAAVHAELGDIRAAYTAELLRFGKKQTPRLDRVRERMDAISGRLDRM